MKETDKLIASTLKKKNETQKLASKQKPHTHSSQAAQTLWY